MENRLLADKVGGLSTSPIVKKVAFRPASVSFLPVHRWSGVRILCDLCRQQDSDRRGGAGHGQVDVLAVIV